MSQYSGKPLARPTHLINIRSVFCALYQLLKPAEHSAPICVFLTKKQGHSYSTTSRLFARLKHSTTIVRTCTVAYSLARVVVWFNEHTSTFATDLWTFWIIKNNSGNDAWPSTNTSILIILQTHRCQWTLVSGSISEGDSWLKLSISFQISSHIFWLRSSQHLTPPHLSLLRARQTEHASAGAPDYSY